MKRTLASLPLAGIFSDGPIMIGVISSWHIVIKGLVIIAAVVVDQAQRELRQRATLMQIARAS